MRCAIYARYSSDVQNARSIEDQILVCSRHAGARQWSVVATFSDAAISGAAMANRPGLLAALAAAERGDFDVLLTEAEDRIARNLEHLAHVVNRLEFVDARLATLSTDKVETMHVAMMGAMAQMFLANLSQKTRRGMASNAEKGLATGSRIYGYRGEAGGQQTIVEDEAEIVREIFRRYARGETGRAICADLNVRGVPGPRGGLWNPSTLSGSRTRGNGLLGTELYIGVKVWNRIEMRKDPRTGQRISIARPKAEWKRTPVPELRIITDEVWMAAQARRDARAALPPKLRTRTPRGVFSGLIKCAECGSSMTAFNSRGRLICAARREKGAAACSNNRSVERAEVEERVLNALRARLLSPSAVKAYVHAYHEALQAEKIASTRAIAAKRKRLGELERSIKRIIDSICEGTDSASMRGRLVEEDKEKALLESEVVELERQAPPAMVIHPKTAEQFAERVAALQAVLRSKAETGEPFWQEVIESVRDMVQRVDVRADAGSEQLIIKLHGTLAAFLEPRAGEPAPRLYKVVAGGGIEPPTCGL